MRKLEQAQSHLSPLTKDGRKDLPFVREAGSGGWKRSLPAESVAALEAAWGPIMRYLEYDLVSGGAGDSTIAGFMLSTTQR